MSEDRETDAVYDLAQQVHTLTRQMEEQKEALEKAGDDLGLIRDVAWALRDQKGMKNLLSIATSGYRDARRALNAMEEE